MVLAIQYQNIDVGALHLETYTDRWRDEAILLVKIGSDDLCFQTPQLPLAWDCVKHEDHGPATFNKMLALDLTSDTAFEEWLLALEGEIKRLLREDTGALLEVSVTKRQLARPLLVMELPLEGTRLLLSHVELDTTPVTSINGTRIDVNRLTTGVQATIIMRLKAVHIGRKCVYVDLVAEAIRVAAENDWEFDMSNITK